MSAAAGSPSESTIAPWLAVEDAERAVRFYEAAFGATLAYRLAGDDGRLAVARLSIGGAALWVQDDPDGAAGSRGSGSVRIILSVEDPDAVFERAVAAGAAVVANVSEGQGWRTGRITDPSGHEWEISRQLTPA